MLGDDGQALGSETQSSGIIGVPPTPGPLPLAMLQVYLPHFRSDLDVQVGDWVVVTSVRRGPLLNPLIAAWEKEDSCLAPASSVTRGPTIPARAPLNHFAAALLRDATAVDVALAPVSRAKHFFTWRKRPRKVMEDATATGSTEAGKSVALYLHVRLGLLTATPPLVFGGATGDFRALVRLTKSPGVAPSEELVPLRFHSETAPKPFFPPWMASVEAEAEKEWHGSRLETTFRLPFPATQPDATSSRSHPSQ